MVLDRGVLGKIDRWGVRGAGSAELLRRGHAGQIVLGHEVMWKLHYHRYGGHGYTRILDFVIPKLIESGYPEREVQMLVVDNPARLLAF